MSGEGQPNGTALPEAVNAESNDMSGLISPRQQNLNPKALIAFEKVAQYGSITKASEDLNVSASAVSRYIKILEGDLGVFLFDRQGGKFILNENGKFFFSEIHGALNRIRSSSWRIARKGSNHLKIWCYPVIAAEWLLPRIEKFCLSFDARISVITGLIPPADTLQYCDVAILSEESVLPSYKSSFLFSEQMVPVCTPAYVKRGPDENGCYPCLSISSTRIRELESWNAQHSNLLQTKNELEFDQSVFAVSAARQGLGIAVAADVWVANDLVAGSLDLPFGNRRLKAHNIYTARSAMAETRMVEIFADWIKEEMHLCQVALSQFYQSRDAAENAGGDIMPGKQYQ